MGFTDGLEEAAEPVWRAIVDHLMVAAFGEGTSDEAPFRHWVGQDYRYLIAYARVFAHGPAKAPDLEQMGAFAELPRSTIDTEMDLHRAYAADAGVSERELDREGAAASRRRRDRLDRLFGRTVRLEAAFLDDAHLATGTGPGDRRW